MSIKIIFGIVIIAASFVYILKRPDKSMMDSLMEKKNRQMQEALEQTESTGETPAEAAGSADEPAELSAADSATAAEAAGRQKRYSTADCPPG